MTLGNRQKPERLQRDFRWGMKNGEEIEGWRKENPSYVVAEWSHCTTEKVEKHT